MRITPSPSIRALGWPLIFFIAGCFNAPVLVPAEGPTRNASTAGGGTLIALGEAWEGSPFDLADYMTPVAVQLVDDGPADVRVSYYDFSLTDDSGFRYAAINPFVSAPRPGEIQQQPMAPASSLAPVLDENREVGYSGTAGPAPGLDEFAMLPAGYLVATRGGGGMHGGAIHASPRMATPRAGAPGVGTQHVTPMWRGAPGNTRWTGYVPYPGYRGWFGPNVMYWTDPFLLPPGYATWVWGWSPAYYPSPTPPPDVVDNAIPEGVLQPGGRVDGFLYFQRLRSEAHWLAISWEVHDGRTGEPYGMARVPLELKR